MGLAVRLEICDVHNLSGVLRWNKQPWCWRCYGGCVRLVTLIVLSRVNRRRPPPAASDSLPLWHAHWYMPISWSVMGEIKQRFKSSTVRFDTDSIQILTIRFKRHVIWTEISKSWLVLWCPTVGMLTVECFTVICSYLHCDQL